MRQLATVVVAILLSAVGVSLAPAAPAAAQASCTDYAYYQSELGWLVEIPTIGPTHRDNCLLGVGNAGTAVKVLQITLNHCYGSGLAEDGIFGPQTGAAVIRAQTAAHVTPDGVYGPQTRDHIRWWEVGVGLHSCSRLRR